MLPGKKYTPADILRIARARWWMALLPAAVAGVGGALYAMTLPDRFRSETVIMVTPQRVPESYVRSTVTQQIDERLASLQQQILSRTRLERLITEFELYPAQRREMPMQDVVEGMRRDIEARPIARGDAFTLAYVAPSARVARDVTERLASMFIEENLRDRTAQAQSTSQFLEAQLEETRQKLERIEAERAEFRSRYMGQLPEQVQTNLAVINSTQMRMQSLTDANGADLLRKANLERQIAELTAPVAAAESPVPAPGASSADYLAGAVPTGTTTAQQLAQAREVEKQLLMRLTEDHPDIRRIRRTIGDLEARLDQEALSRPIAPTAPAGIAAEARQDPRALRVQELREELSHVSLGIKQRQVELDRLNATLGQYQSRVDSSPSLENQLMQIERDYTTTSAQYSDLLVKVNSANMAAGVEERQIGEQFRILDPARIPERPFSPNRLQIAGMSLAGGLALGLALIGLLEYRDSSFRTQDDVIAVLALPVVAAIPTIRTVAEKRRAARRRWLASAAAVVALIGGLAAVVWRYGL